MVHGRYQIVPDFPGYPFRVHAVAFDDDGMKSHFGAGIGIHVARDRTVAVVVETEGHVNFALASAEAYEFTHGGGTWIDGDDRDHELPAGGIVVGSDGSRGDFGQFL